MPSRIFPLGRRHILAKKECLLIKPRDFPHLLLCFYGKIKPKFFRHKPSDLWLLIRKEQRGAVVNHIIAIAAAPPYRKPFLIAVSQKSYPFLLLTSSCCLLDTVCRHHDWLISIDL